MDIKNLSSERLLEIFNALVLPRKIEERMLLLLRQNKISKWFSGIGQEAIAVGTTLTLHESDFILPMHRNLGVFTSRHVPLYPLFCQLLGREDGFTQGRERSFHFGLHEYNIYGMISHLAAMLPVADGLALSSKLRNQGRVAVAFCGDGATSEGDFHEALNLAAVWKLPVIFMVENNGYGLSTPVSEQYACDKLSDRALGYGMHGERIDGNDIIAVMNSVEQARIRALDGMPTLIEALTFRMRGHEEASGVAYIPSQLFDEWSMKDPILRFRRALLEDGRISKEVLSEIETEIEAGFRAELDRAVNAPKPVFNIQKELGKVVSPIDENSLSPIKHNEDSVVERRFIDAVQHALHSFMKHNNNAIIMGQDVAEYGGVFKVTQGFIEEFGKHRVRNTPIIESGAIGAALGLAYEDWKPVVEMQFSDFISCGFNQIVNNVAKSHYRWSKPVNMTIRCPFGAGVGAGPFHSQSPENWFMTVPGLKIVVPATVEDAQNLSYSAYLDPNPVLIFEHKALYRSLKTNVSTEIVPEILGKAKTLKSGNDVTIIAYGISVQWALQAVEELEQEFGVSIEILDLRCLQPLDIDSIVASVKKTGRAFLLEEPALTMSPMSEVSALISEHCFRYLDAPPIRCASLDMPIPFSPELEKNYLAKFRFKEEFKRLLAY